MTQHRFGGGTHPGCTGTPNLAAFNTAALVIFSLLRGRHLVDLRLPAWMDSNRLLQSGPWILATLFS